jgi:hypothetical protein
MTNRLYKPALLDYAIAFEIFLEAYLRSRLNARLGPRATEAMLKENWRVRDRCKKVLRLATGYGMSDRNDVYQPWDVHVRKPRDDVAHGRKSTVKLEEAEKAHQAVYQAIRWIESL